MNSNAIGIFVIPIWINVTKIATSLRSEQSSSSLYSHHKWPFLTVNRVEFTHTKQSAIGDQPYEWVESAGDFLSGKVFAWIWAINTSPLATTPLLSTFFEQTTDQQFLFACLFLVFSYSLVSRLSLRLLTNTRGNSALLAHCRCFVQVGWRAKLKITFLFLLSPARTKRLSVSKRRFQMPSLSYFLFIWCLFALIKYYRF